MSINTVTSQGSIGFILAHSNEVMAHSSTKEFVVHGSILSRNDDDGESTQQQPTTTTTTSDDHVSSVAAASFSTVHTSFSCDGTLMAVLMVLPPTDVASHFSSSLSPSPLPCPTTTTVIGSDVINLLIEHVASGAQVALILAAESEDTTNIDRITSSRASDDGNGRRVAATCASFVPVPIQGGNAILTVGCQLQQQQQQQPMSSSIVLWHQRRSQHFSHTLEAQTVPFIALASVDGSTANGGVDVGHVTALAFCGAEDTTAGTIPCIRFATAACPTSSAPLSEFKVTVWRIATSSATCVGDESPQGSSGDNCIAIISEVSISDQFTGPLISSLALSQRHVAMGDSNGVIHVWKSPRAAATDGCCCMERVAELTAGHSQKHTIAAMAFSPNGNMLISGSSDSSIVAWDASNSAPTCITKLTVHNHHSAPTRYEVPHHSVVVSIAFHPGGHYFYTASTDNVVRRWDAAQLQSTPIKEHRRKTTADDAKALVDTIKLGHVAISPDGTVLASSLLVQASSLSSSPQDYFSRCIVTTELTGHLYRVASLVGHTGGITCIAIAPGGGESDGRRHHHHHVVTGSRDGTIRLWRGDSGRCISTSEGINSSSPVMVHCVAFSDDGRVIVATLADDNGTFEIRAFWTLERFSTGALLKVKHDEKLRSLTVTAHLMNNDDSDGTFGEQKAQLLQPTTAHNCYKITMIESFEGQSGIQEEGSSVAVFQMPAPTVPMITKLDITTKSSPRATTPIAAIFDVISAGPYLPVNDKKFVVKYFHEHILDNPHVERELRFVIQQNAALKHNNIIHLWALVEEVDNDGEEGCGHCNSTLTKRRHSSMSATGVTKQKRCSSGVRRIVGMVMEFCPSTLERFVAHSLPPTPSSGSFAFVGGSGVGSVVPMTNSPKRLGLDESGVMLESSLRKLGYLHDIASALAFAHSHNIIHSDVRPSNILIDVNDVAKLSDFSSAHVITKNSESFTGSRGSSLFTAPEYACGDTPPTVAADIFSFGMMVWWTMAIADPFDSHKLGRNDVQIALSLYHEKRPPIEHLLGDNLGSPIAGLATLVSDCWAHNPAERPASMDVVRQRLETVLVKCNAAGWGLASSVEGKENDDASSTTRASPVPDGGDLSLLVPPTTMNNVPLIHLSQLTVAKSPFVSDMTSSVYVAEITNHALQTTRHAFKRFHKPAWKLITAEINASLALLSQTQHVQQVARIAGIVVDFSANPTKITATSKSDESLAIGVLYEDEFEAALLPQSLIGRWSNDFIFSSKTLNYFFHQIASSLARAHERDIVHGDVNPNCILLAPTPPEMVLTVGAERSSIHYISKLTDFGSCEGKPQPMFVAPVAASKDDFDCDVMLGTPSKEADVFCFAMTMCYILSPIAIHEFSKTSIQMSMQLQNHQRPDLTNRGVPNELVELISRCWVDDPAKRPNINDVMETLTELLLVEAPSSSVTSPTTQQLRLSFSFPLSALQNSTDSLPVESQNIIVTLPQLGELKLLATGASSMVYKGKINLGGKETRDCAVKQLHVKNMSDITHSVMPIHEHGVLGTSSSPSSRQQKRKEYISLSREINVAYSLRHPHIVNVFALLVKSVITATTGEEKSIVISDENSNDIATASPPPTGPLIIDGIVMEYCEHGTLLSAAKKVFAGDKTAGMAAATKSTQSRGRSR
ncbi:WD40 repeat-containing protein, putative [Bodo saltans]|uniref:WD40 repeat-containing protein, putative n=1 Tax=Bodo saltans TaxID=75058 RepID=A0A0S4JNQ2_BODSA|nr:WD40 repeat-containing protein, putative [Bodo saltans]|eukprot:CUG90135.1 WD40 repeat-containing protein, putative [Bodo saltans]